MKNLKYILITIIVFFTDMFFKNRIEQGMQGKKPFGRFITLSKHHNRGLPMNIAESHQKKIAIASFITTGMLELYFYYVLIKKDNPLLKTGLSLQVGGAYSNTYDRLMRKYVVDYFSFNYPKAIRNIVFNLGDIAIFAGWFMVILSSIFTRDRNK
ncbi:MAG: signal peptidase II [Lachnospiraceae bacterium]|nr:signal peptidase II [Lachnospiraceae bacterium]